MRPDGTWATQTRLVPFSGSDGTRWQILIKSEKPEVQTVDGNPYYAWKAIKVSDYTEEDIIPYYDTPEGFTPFGFWDDIDDIDLNEIQFAQAGDMLFLVHADFCPIRISYNMTGYAGFYLWPFPDTRVYGDEGESDRAMPFRTPATGVTNPFVIRATTAGTVGAAVTLETIVADDLFEHQFDETWIGRQLKLSATGDTLVVLITAIVDVGEATGIVVTGTINASPTNFGSGSTSYELPSWNAADGWPRTVCFFETRLVMGGTRTLPDTIWFSQTNDIYEFDALGLQQDTGYADPTEATDPFTSNLRSEVLNQIRWMSPAKTITTGTNSREFVVQGPSQSSSIGPTNIQTSAESSLGSAYTQATRIENVAAFLHRDRRSIHEMVYNFNEDSFQVTNLNIIAEHIASAHLGDRDGEYEEFSKCNIVALAMQNSPDGILWCLDNNGFLLGMTRERQQQVIAWHRHKLGGVGEITSLDFTPFIQSISIIQRPESDETGGEPDELWMAVARVTSEDNGSGTLVAAKRIFIEKLALPWERPDMENGWESTGTLRYGPVYVDCAFIFDSGDVDPLFPGIINELNHGDGSEVEVIVNGIYLGTKTVTGGCVDIEDDLDGLGLLAGTWQAIVGYNYLGELEPVVPEVPAPTGSSQNLPRRTTKLTVNVVRSYGFKFGRSTDSSQDSTPMDDLEEVELAGDTSELMEPFSGQKQLSFPMGYEPGGRVRIQAHLPFPFHISHLTQRMVAYEP